jgi:hypothetical protein
MVSTWDSTDDFSAPPAAAEEDVAIVVVSCDRYADLWSDFLHCFFHFWPECPYAVYVISNHIPCRHPRAHALTVGDDTTWSRNLQIALARLPHRHIVLMVEDLFLLAPVVTTRIRALVREFIARDGNCLKLTRTVPGSERVSAALETSLPGAPYRCSAVFTLWKAEVLRDVLRPHESAWDFEIQGSARTDAYGGFYVVRESPFVCANAVVRGRWSRAARQRIHKTGVALQPTARPIMSRPAELIYQAALLRARLLYRLPGRTARTWLDRARRWRDSWKRGRRP